jgi:hypothetical protein
MMSEEWNGEDNPEDGPCTALAWELAGVSAAAGAATALCIGGFPATLASGECALAAGAIAAVSMAKRAYYTCKCDVLRQESFCELIRRDDEPA